MLVFIFMIKKIIVLSFLISAFLLGFWISFVKALKMGITKVPDVRGKTIEEAEKILKNNNLEFILDVNLSGYSEKIKQGYILKQEPIEGFTIKSGNSVRLGLSLGASKVAIPDFTHKHYYEVELYLKSHNLKLGNISYIDSIFEESIVLSQFPFPNSVAPAETPIDLLISRPNNVQAFLMPNFISKNYNFVLNELTIRGFKVEKPREIKIPHYETEIILSQSPLPGTKITKKTPIIFTLNIGI